MLASRAKQGSPARRGAGGWLCLLLAGALGCGPETGLAPMSDVSAGGVTATGGTGSGAGTLGSGGAAAGSAGLGQNAGSGGILGCPGGESPCPTGCEALATDPANCGTCGNACQPAEMCSAGFCVPSCPQGQTDCGGTCVDLQSNHDHCGDCTTVCGTDQQCVAGDCACPMGETDCLGVCANLATDDDNCGQCGMACLGGRTCQPGGCQCAVGQTVCDDACVDLLTDELHCGDCEEACGEGMACEGGECACAEGLDECPAGCFDLTSDPENCGDCGRSCNEGETCNAGSCGGGVGQDDCMGLAQNVSLETVAVYQAVEIPLMDGGDEVPVVVRDADVVAGRLAVFRIFVSVGDGWTARQLSARLHIVNGDAIQTHFTKLVVDGPSDPLDLGSTFQIEVPGQEITTATRYSVELVECATGSGEVASPRYPETADVALGARATGTLKIRFIPLRTHIEGDDAIVPDTSEATLEGYRSWLQAMLPVTDVEISVDEPYDMDGFNNWTAALYELAEVRVDRGVEPDEYVYGLVKPEADFAEYCAFSCTAGIGFVVPEGGFNSDGRVAIGVGYTDNEYYLMSSATTMVHEVGHNHGRDHAPCGNPDMPDPGYPYDGGGIGVLGYDYRDQSFLSTENTDIMGYCDARWISDYTYAGMLERIAEVNGAAQPAVLGRPVGTFHVLTLGPEGSAWRRPIDRPRAPIGTPEAAEILDHLGNVVTSTTVYRLNVADTDASSIWVPTPQTGWYAVRVAGAAPVVFLTATPAE